MTDSHWRKSGFNAPLKDFLKEREAYCVSACARILKWNWLNDDIWTLCENTFRRSVFLPNTAVQALFFHSQRSVFPIFGRDNVPDLPFLERFLKKVPIHAIQGLQNDVAILEDAVFPYGFKPAETVDYELMALDTAPIPLSRTHSPAGLVLRKPLSADMDRLFRLQSAYEQEEVLPRGVEFNAAACRLLLEQIVAHEQMLIACIGPRIVGKINTSAKSFSRYQVGGVFVHPDYRGQGIASRMALVFVNLLRAQGRNISLFVRMRNTTARAIYRNIGFHTLGTYRISYY
jgi:ribosomal protein S18 acetylase RimI-like enzyme